MPSRYTKQVKWPHEVRRATKGYQLVIHDGATFAIVTDLKAESENGADREAARYLEQHHE